MSNPAKPRPLFLAHGAGSTGLGYTTRPLREVPLVADEPDMVERIASATSIRDEPESVGPAIVDGYAEIAQFQHSLRHQRDVEAARVSRPLLAVEDRLKDIRRRAKAAHVDLSHETHLMQRDLDRARQRAQPAPARVTDRAERLEALLDGVEQ